MPKCVLVIDSVPTNRIRLAAMLEAAQYEVVTASNPHDVTRHGLIEPDLLVLGIHGDSPAASVTSLVTFGPNQDAPIFCLDNDATPLRRLQALRAGARELLSYRMPDALFLARLRSLIRESEAEREYQRRRVTAASFGLAEAAEPFQQAARVSYISSQGSPATIPEILTKSLPHTIETLAVDKALCETSDDTEPDAYVLATGTDDTALETVLPELRVRTHSRHAPVLVIYPENRPELGIRALNLGASDAALENATSDELSIRINSMLRRKRLRDTLRQSEEQSYRAAATDSLTGLYNRRYAEAYLADLLMREKDQGRGYILMLLDLDHFKIVNDTHGHPVGDQVLCEVAKRLRDNLRAGDLVARWGGEEFLVILPDTDTDEGRQTGERLRTAIGRTPVMLENGTALPVTASIGVGYGYEPAENDLALRTGTYDLPGTQNTVSLSQLVDAADTALYRAKTAGRNRVEFSAV